MRNDCALTFHMASPTHYANLMIRYMVASKLSSYIPELQLSNIDLPYWNIFKPNLDLRDEERVCRLVAEQHVPFNQIKYLADAGLLTRVDWYGYGQRMENFPARAVCSDLFRAEPHLGLDLPEDCLLCPIRAGEILDAIHPGYTIVPVEFYEEIVETTGLQPVFMGQTADNVFTSKLRSRFPKARFLAHTSALDDFQTIRKARNIVLPVSTFAWLAAWLSDATQIFFPVYGIFNPRLFALHDLLPISETRYRFYQFPEQPAVPLAQLEESHRAIKGQWREVESFALAVRDL